MMTSRSKCRPLKRSSTLSIPGHPLPRQLPYPQLCRARGVCTRAVQNLDALNAHTNITSIALTDGGTPILTLSIAEALSDTRALSEITSQHTTALADTAADI